jgi:hypothetical protein
VVNSARATSSMAQLVSTRASRQGMIPLLQDKQHHRVAERGSEATGAPTPATAQRDAAPTSMLRGSSFVAVAAKRNIAFTARQCTQHDDYVPMTPADCPAATA